MIRERWQQRSPRERVLITLGLGVIAAGALFEGLVVPLSASRAELEKTLPRLRAQALSLERQTSASRSPNALTQAALRDSLARARLEADRVQIDGGRVELDLKAAPLDQALRGLSEAGTQFSLAVQTLDVRMQGGLARVQVRLAP